MLTLATINFRAYAHQRNLAARILSLIQRFCSTAKILLHEYFRKYVWIIDKYSTCQMQGTCIRRFLRTNAFAREEKRVCWTCKTLACDQRNAFARGVKRIRTNEKTCLLCVWTCFTRFSLAYETHLPYRKYCFCSAYEMRFAKDIASLLCVDQLLNVLTCLKRFHVHVPRG